MAIVLHCPLNCNIQLAIETGMHCALIHDGTHFNGFDAVVAWKVESEFPLVL